MNTTADHARTDALGDPVSWRALGPGADVYSADGRRVGMVTEVLAAPDLDVFHGVIVETRMGPGGSRSVEAGDIAGIYGGLIVLSMPAAGVAGLPEPRRRAGLLRRLRAHAAARRVGARAQRGRVR